MSKRRRMTSSTPRPRTNRRRLPLLVETLEPRCMFAADAAASVEPVIQVEDVAVLEARPLPTPEDLAPTLDGAIDPIDQGSDDGDFAWDAMWKDLTPWFPTGDEMPSFDEVAFDDEVAALGDAWMPLPYWRSGTGGEFTDWTTADSVDFSYCGDGFSQPIYPVAYAAAGLFGDHVGDQPFGPGSDWDNTFDVTVTSIDVADGVNPGPWASDFGGGTFVPGPFDDVTAVGGPAGDTPSLVVADPQFASTSSGGDGGAAATADAGKPRALAFAAFAGNPGTFANPVSGPLGGPPSGGDGGGDAGFGGRRRFRR